MYNIKWIMNHLIHKVINKPVKGYKRVLTIKEMIKLGGFKICK